MQTVATIGGVLFNLAFCWIWIIIFPRADHSEEEHTNLSNEPDTEEPPPTTDIATKPVAKEKPKVLYINNIKIFLTAMVVLVHCVTETPFKSIPDSTASPSSREWLLSGGLSILASSIFGNTQQSYFMHLFFFFSGYFVPRSFDKKGTRNFLIGRARRLGIPLVLFVYLLNLATSALFIALIWGNHTDSSLIMRAATANPSHLWFVLMLLIYGIAYAFGCGKGWSPKVSCPSMLQFLLSSIVLGLIAFVVGLFFPTNSSSKVLTVPLGGPSVILTYTVFFFYGAVAQRNNWMEDIKSKSRIAIYSWAIVSWLLFATFLILNDGNIPFLNTLFDFFMFGYMPVPLSLAVTVFFMDLLNKEFFFTDFFAKSMYTVYIIQWFPIVIGAYLWYLVLQATNNVVEVIPPFAVVVSGNMAIPGWLFIATVSMIIVWPLAYAIRSIPGFSKVL